MLKLQGYNLSCVLEHKQSESANSAKAAAVLPPGEWQYIVYKMPISQR